MPSFALAHIKLRFSDTSQRQFNEHFSTLRALLEEQGMSLRHSLAPGYGTLFEVWNLWEVQDANHMVRARKAIRDDERFGVAHHHLAEVIEFEELRYLEELPLLSGQ